MCSWKSHALWSVLPPLAADRRNLTFPARSRSHKHPHTRQPHHTHTRISLPLQSGPEPEFWVQNLLAAGLLAVLALSAGNVALKLLVVAFSLTSAALRYCIIAILLMVVLARWGVDPATKF